MTRNGWVRRIGYLCDDRNRIEQQMRRGKIAGSDPSWRAADRRIVDAVAAALAAGVVPERIQAITWREPVMR